MRAQMERVSHQEFAFADLAREYFGRTPKPAEAAALALCLHGSPMHFYKKGKGRYRPAPANALQAVKITTLPGAGSLTDNGVAVTAGQSVSVADITGGLLKFAPAVVRSMLSPAPRRACERDRSCGGESAVSRYRDG